MLDNLKKILFLLLFSCLVLSMISCSEDEEDPLSKDDDEYPWLSVVSTTPDISIPTPFHPDSLEVKEVVLEVDESKEFFAESFNKSKEKLPYSFQWSTNRSYSVENPNPPYIAKRDTLDLPYGELAKSCTFFAAGDYGKAEVYATVDTDGNPETLESDRKGVIQFFVPKALASLEPIWGSAVGTGTISDSIPYAYDEMFIGFSGLPKTFSPEKYEYKVWLIDETGNYVDADVTFTTEVLDDLGAYNTEPFHPAGVGNSIIETYKGMALSLESQTGAYGEENKPGIILMHYVLPEDAPDDLVGQLLFASGEAGLEDYGYYKILSEELATTISLTEEMEIAQENEDYEQLITLMEKIIHVFDHEEYPEYDVGLEFGVLQSTDDIIEVAESIDSEDYPSVNEIISSSNSIYKSYEEQPGDVAGIVEYADSLFAFAEAENDTAFNYIGKIRGNIEGAIVQKNSGYSAAQSILSFYAKAINPGTDFYNAPKGSFIMTKYDHLDLRIDNISNITDISGLFNADEWEYEVWLTDIIRKDSPRIKIDPLSFSSISDMDSYEHNRIGENGFFQGQSDEYIQEVLSYYLLIELMIAPPGSSDYSDKILVSQGFISFENVE